MNGNKLYCVGCFERTASKHVYYLGWNRSPSPGWMHETSARTWCTVKTQRNQVEREVGVGIGMVNTCNSMADSCQCMTKPLQYCKVISLHLIKINEIKTPIWWKINENLEYQQSVLIFLNFKWINNNKNSPLTMTEKNVAAGLHKMCLKNLLYIAWSSLFSLERNLNVKKDHTEDSLTHI